MQEIPNFSLLAENHLVEAIDLVGRTEASGGTLQGTEMREENSSRSSENYLIDSLNLDVKAGVASDAIRCLACTAQIKRQPRACSTNILPSRRGGRRERSQRRREA